MTINEFIEEVKSLGLNPTKEILEKLDIYAKFLQEYNEHTNLTAINLKKNLKKKLFLKFF